MDGASQLRPALQTTTPCPSSLPKHTAPPQHLPARAPGACAAGVFANNRVSGLLRRDHPTSLADLVMVFGDESFWAFTKVLRVIHLVPHPAACQAPTNWQRTLQHARLAPGSRAGGDREAGTCGHAAPLHCHNWPASRLLQLTCTGIAATESARSPHVQFTDAMALDAPHPNAFATATGGLNYWQWYDPRSGILPSLCTACSLASKSPNHATPALGEGVPVSKLRLSWMGLPF